MNPLVIGATERTSVYGCYFSPIFRLSGVSIRLLLPSPERQVQRLPQGGRYGPSYAHPAHYPHRQIIPRRNHGSRLSISSTNLKSRGRRAKSGYDFFDDLASDVGEAELTALEQVGQLLVIDSQ